MELVLPVGAILEGNPPAGLIFADGSTGNRVTMPSGDSFTWATRDGRSRWFVAGADGVPGPQCYGSESEGSAELQAWLATQAM